MNGLDPNLLNVITVWQKSFNHYMVREKKQLSLLGNIIEAVKIPFLTLAVLLTGGRWRFAHNHLRYSWKLSKEGVVDRQITRAMYENVCRFLEKRGDIDQLEFLEKVTAAHVQAQKWPELLEFRMDDDKDVWIALLHHASDEVKKDQEAVLEIVQQNGLALGKADISLRKNKDVARAAMKQNKDAFEFVDPSIQEELKHELEGHVAQRKAVRSQDQGSIKSQYLNLWKEDAEVAFSVLKNDPIAIQYINPTRLRDKKFMIRVAQEIGFAFALAYADESLRDDYEFMSACVKTGGNLARKFTNPRLLSRSVVHSNLD